MNRRTFLGWLAAAAVAPVIGKMPSAPAPKADMLVFETLNGHLDEEVAMRPMLMAGDTLVVRWALTVDDPPSGHLSQYGYSKERGVDHSIGVYMPGATVTRYEL